MDVNLAKFRTTRSHSISVPMFEAKDFRASLALISARMPAKDPQALARVRA